MFKLNVLDYLQEEGEKIDREIDRILSKNGEPEALGEACRHLVEAGGKRLRPALTLVSAEAVGGESEKTLESAAALELLHTFTLVHDDIMDKDHSRRGVGTVHELWSEPLAIITGDALFAKVFEALTEGAKNKGLPVEKVIAMFETVSKASLRICEGQALDIQFEGREKVAESEYMDMVEKKTGVLMEASMKIGAIVGKGTEEEIDALAEYGRLLGIAFQIHDDYLGVVGDQKKLGKPIGSDIREGKWTFLAVHAYRKATEDSKKVLLDILKKEDVSDEEVEKVIDIYEKTGTIDFAQEKSKKMVERAKKKLDIISDSEYKDFLMELADFSVEREL